MRRLSPLPVLVSALALAAALTPSAGAASDKTRVSLGAGVIVSPKPYVGVDAEITPLPVFGLRYRAFYFEGIRTGFRGRPHPNLELDSFVQARFDGYDAVDSPALAGMSDRDLSMDFGARIAGVWDGVEVGLTALTDVLDESDGQEVDLGLSFPFEAGRWRLEPSATVAWWSEDLVSHYFGVRPGEALPGRPAYAGDDTINLEIGFEALRSFDSGWTILFGVDWIVYGDEIKQSPIVEDDSGLKALAAVLYTFGARGR